MGYGSDEEFRRAFERFLEPGDIDLNGVIVHTDLSSDEDIQMMEVTIEIGDIVATHAGFEPTDCYIYSGNDDPEFSLNQHQGRTIDGDEFVWECQQLVRNGSFDIAIYYEASADQSEILYEIESLGFETTSVKTA